MIRSHPKTRALLLAALVSGTVALSAPAFADADAPPRGAISARGVDFASPSAVAHFKNRMRRVAMSMCSASGDASLMDRSERECYETAVKDGLAQIDSRQQQALRDRAVLFADSRGDGAVGR